MNSPTQQYIPSFLRISKRKEKIFPQIKKKNEGGDDQNYLQIWMVTLYDKDAFSWENSMPFFIFALKLFFSTYIFQ